MESSSGVKVASLFVIVQSSASLPIGVGISLTALLIVASLTMRDVGITIYVNDTTMCSQFRQFLACNI